MESYVMWQENKKLLKIQTREFEREISPFPIKIDDVNFIGSSKDIWCCGVIGLRPLFFYVDLFYLVGWTLSTT